MPPAHDKFLFPSHFDGVRFFNPDGKQARGLLDVLRWKLTTRGAKSPAFLRDVQPSVPVRSLPEQQIRVTLINHSTVLLQANGLNILTDPVWSERASPLPAMGPRRHRAPGVRFADLPPIDMDSLRTFSRLGRNSSLRAFYHSDMQSFTSAAPASPDLARKPLPVIIVLSVFIASALVWLIYFKGKVAAPAWVSVLPAANAVFNSLSAICLTLGYINIRRGNRIVHMRFMVTATVFSTLFLLSYVTYHYFHGDTKFPGHGWIRPIYFFILISHIGLSTIALPFILATLWYALRSQFRFHQCVARWTFPIWLYVSVTGVIVFGVLRAYTS